MSTPPPEMYDGEPTRWERTIELVVQILVAIRHPIAVYRALKNGATE